MAAHCKDCGSEIRWFQPMRPDGKPMPVDVSPDPDEGTIRRHISGPSDKTILRGEALKGDALIRARADGERLWMHHADTCSEQKPFNPKPAGLSLNLPPARPSRRRFR